MYIRNHKEDDYALFCEWWASWGWAAIPYEFLPASSMVVCDDEDVPICAVFLYRTDTPILWAEHYISCKNHKMRGTALEFMLELLPEAAKAMGAKIVMSAIKHKSLQNRLDKAGFAIADKGLNTYLLVV